MVSLTSSSSSTPKISFDFTKNISTSLNVPVSSSYLRSKEEAVVTTKKPIEPCKTLNININPKGDQKLRDEKKALEDQEIGVFGAEKYFNGDMDSDQSSTVLSLTNPEAERFVDDLKQSEKKSTGAPSVRSESSWNSQSMLLQNKLVNSCNGSVQEKKNNSSQIQKVNNHKKSFLLNLGCKCACSDGISVDVDDKILVKRTSDLIKIHKQEELAQRKSLEVSQKKLTLPPCESRTEEEDTKSEGSDTSSDLFEIDNITGKPKSFLARQGSDPTCYAPSEVSIEWSIVTASAADLSVMSECATSPLGRNRFLQVPPRIPTKTAPQRQKPSSGSGGFLMSCKSHKSVMVSGDSDRRRSMNKTSPSYVPRHVHVMESTKRKSFETSRRISNCSPAPLLYSQY
ncbi:Protein PHYTOCHROME KINASE SUBSTRATE 1 [Hirschfeldia incana]|nr:Protein PHYTOCHROME KINASE SUBSTRATE 1 [Hirschfeldia incana]